MSIVFRQLSMTNFMPFYGRHAIEFTVKRPVTIVYGENMWGKTTILNAFRWVWYGIALDRFKNNIARRRLVNWDAVDERNFSMQVDLFFLVDKDEFQLSRKIQPKYEESIPERDVDFEELLFLTKNDRSIKTSDIQPLLNSLLPLKVSDFFLFDGEQLDEYEQLLLDPDSQSSLIQDSIEDILGLPALTNAIKDLGANHKDAAKRQRSLAAKDRAAKSYVDMAERTEAAIDNTEMDLQQLTDQRNSIIREIQSLDKTLRETAGIESEIQRLNDIQSNIKQLKDELTRLEDERKRVLAGGWVDLVVPVVSQRLEELRNEQSKYMSSLEHIGELRARLKQIERLLSEKLCPLCGQSYPENIIQSAERDRDEIAISLENVQLDQDRLDYIGEAIRKLSKITTSGAAAALQQIEENSRRSNVNLVGLETKRDDIQRKLEGHDQAAIAENRIRYNQLNKRLGTIEEHIREKQTQLQHLKSEAADYRNKIGQTAGPQLTRLNREVGIYESLIDIYTGAVERLKKQLKADIEVDATRVFLQLTTDSSYQKLQINERYGLTIIREGNREVPIRSAGAEQIVALSLISALNMNAVRRAPVIMDTPFGRLDPTHRANVLKFLSNMTNQVVLLVHSGEIDRGADIDRISNQIDAEYVIERLSGVRSGIQKSSYLVGET